MAIVYNILLLLIICIVSSKCDLDCVHAIFGDNCIYQFSYGLKPNIKRIACLPLTSSFTWASSIDPFGNIAYAMGGKSSNYRNLFTVNLTTGQIIYEPIVGYVYNTTYHLAADLRGNGRLYGLWNEPSSYYRPAEISPITGNPIRFLLPDNWNPPNDDGCFPTVGFSTNHGFFDLNGNNYVSIWTCTRYSYVVRINVDNLMTSYNAFQRMSLNDFGVHPSSGRAYGLQMVGKMAYIYELTSIPRVISTIVVPSASWDLVLYQLVFLKDAVCAYEPQDSRRAHPQDPDLMCTMIGDGGDYTGSSLFTIPGLGVINTDLLPYIRHSIPSKCLF